MRHLRAAARAARPPPPASTAASPPPPAPASHPTIPAAPPASAYVHLPFCVRRCLYCDFPVHALGAHRAPVVGGRGPPPEVGAYVETLLREVAATAAATATPAPPPLSTVSFGGGTPSLVAPADVGRILDALAAKHGMAGGCEVTLEADPGTFDASRLAAYLAAGVTRFSIGVQSFDDALLTACGRSHGAADARRALAAVAASGAASWSLDLMSGLPGLTLDGWDATLREALSYAPPGVSVYDLTIEPATPFARAAARGALPLPPDSDAAAMLAAAAEALPAAGLARVEVSSWARAGAACRHNGTYWRGDADYHAYGVGATSRLGGVRVARPRGLAAWRAWVDALEAGDGVPGGAAALHPPHRDDVLLEVVMLRLRTAAGLDAGWVAAAHSAAAADAVERALDAAAARGLATARPGSGGRRAYALTDPAGFLVSNDVISDVFVALDRAQIKGSDD